MPTTRPIIIANQKYFKGRIAGSGISKSFGDICREGKSLHKIVVVIVAASVAVEAVINIMGEKRRCASSIAKIIPVRGAPVAAANPLQAPPVIV